MGTAELIDLVMNLVIYPCLIIVDTIIQKCVMNIIFSQSVDNLKLVLELIKSSNFPREVDKQKMSTN